MEIWKDKHTMFIHFKTSNSDERKLLIELSKHIAESFAQDDGAVEACSLSYGIGTVEITMRLHCREENK